MSVLHLAEAPAEALLGAPADRGLLTALAAGEEATWHTTVRRYESLLRSAARVVLRSDADIDEAVQRTWVLLLRNADRIKDPQCLAGWLSTTARREALSILRGQQRAIPSEDVADRVAPGGGSRPWHGGDPSARLVSLPRRIRVRRQDGPGAST